MGLAEEFQADLESRQQSQKFQLENDFRAYLKDQAQGGSIRQAPIEPNLPIGAVVGGVGSAIATGGNPGAAILGATAGEAAQQLVEHAIQSPAAPKTTGEAAIRMTREGVTQGLFELGGAIGGFLVNRARAWAPFAKTVTPEAKEAMDFVTQHGGKEQSLLPAEMTSNRFLDIMQNISEHSILGGGAITAFKQDRDQFNAKLAETIVGHYGPAMDADAIGRAVVDSASRNLESAKFPAKFIYEAIESQAAPAYAKAPKTVKVMKDTQPITKSVVDKMTVKAVDGEDDALEGLKVKTTFQDIQVGEQLQRMKVMITEQERQIGGSRIDLRPLKDELAGLTRISRESGGLADAAMGNTLMAFIEKKPDIVSYPVAKAMRTEVRAYRDQLANAPETKNAPGIGKAKSVYDKLTERIRAGLADDDPFLATMWDEANLIEAGANQQFNTKMIRELVKLADIHGANAPEAIVEKVWRPGRPTQVKVVRNAVDPSTWQKMQRTELADLMQRSTKDGVVEGKALQNTLFGPGGIGKDVLQAGFDPATVKELEGFAKTLLVQQAKAPDSTGRMWIQLAQATQAVQAIGAAAAFVGATSHDYGGAGLTAAGATILFTPPVIAHIMTSPNGIKWLTQGLSAAPKSKQLTYAAAQLAKILEGGLVERTPLYTPPDTAETRQAAPPASPIAPFPTMQ